MCWFRRPKVKRPLTNEDRSLSSGLQLSQQRHLGLTIMSADLHGNCLGGQHQVPVKFGVSARSGCFIKSALFSFTKAVVSSDKINAAMK